MKTIRSRPVAALAGLLAVLGAVAAAEPAQAATNTSDCFPGVSQTNPSFVYCTDASYRGVYYSAGNQGASARGQIQWDKAKHTVTVAGYAYDLKSDGNGPHVIIHLRKNGASKRYVFIDHAGQFLSPAMSTGDGPDSADEITIQVCNGHSDSTGYQNCSAAHGPFHP